MEVKGDEFDQKTCETCHSRNNIGLVHESQAGPASKSGHPPPPIYCNALLHGIALHCMSYPLPLRCVSLRFVAFDMMRSDPMPRLHHRRCDAIMARAAPGPRRPHQIQKKGLSRRKRKRTTKTQSVRESMRAVERDSGDAKTSFRMGLGIKRKEVGHEAN